MKKWLEFVELSEQSFAPPLLGTSDYLLREKEAVFRLLLPNVRNAKVLYIGDSSSQILANLSGLCHSITAVLPSNTYLEFITKKDSYAGNETDNIRYFSLSDKSCHELIDKEFDGVIVEQPFGLDEHFLSIDSVRLKADDAAFWTSVISQSPWVLVKTKNLLNRNFLNQSLVTRLLSSCSSFSLYNRSTLRRAGLKKVSRFGIDNLTLAVDRLVNLDDNHQIDLLSKSGSWRLKLFPRWAYRLTVPAQVDLLAKDGASVKSSVSVLVAQVAKKLDLKPDNLCIDRVEVNGKNKCTLFLTTSHHEFDQVVVKVGLDDMALQHLQHNFACLQQLQNKDIFSKTVSDLFSTPLGCGKVNSLDFFIESCGQGAPWSDQQQQTGRHMLIDQIFNILYELQCVSADKISVPDSGSQSKKIEEVIKFVNSQDPSLGNKMTDIVDAVLVTENSEGDLFFYKSDFTVSNVLVEEGEMKSLIDMDFWGVSRHKLVDFADFIISYSRITAGLKLSDMLSAIFSGNLAQFPVELELEKNLSRFNCNIQELKSAVIVSWCNSIHHVLQIKRLRMNASHLERLLFDPLQKI